jgi:hypothetical protein
VKCARLILHDFKEVTILQAPIQPFTNLAKPDTGYASLATIVAEAPYQRPNSVDFARIASLLTAKHHQIVDHIWSLREDPGYYEAQMSECMEHRRELLVNVHGRQHPFCSAGKERKLWARAIVTQIARAYLQLEIAAKLLPQAKALGNMQTLFANEISTPAEFPREYEAAIFRFKLNLLQGAGLSSIELCDGFHASPPMRRFHLRGPDKDIAGDVDKVYQLPTFNDDPVRSRLYWLLMMNWKSDSMEQMIGFCNVVDELHRLVEAAPANTLLSPYLAFIVGDMAIFSECYRRLELYQPLSQKNNDLFAEKAYEAEQEFEGHATSWDSMIGSIPANDYELGTLGGPFDGKFNYPIAKRRTRENVEILRNAERNLDVFWRKVDQQLGSNCGGLGESAVHRLLAQGRQLQRTPEWVEPEREGVQPRDEELYIPFSQLSFNDNGSCDQSLRQSSDQQPKEKIKTRKGGDSGDVPAEAEVVIPSAEAQTEPAFALNARALKVFKTVFFTPSLTSTPGEVAWADFLYAMVSVGFIPEKLYGAVWQFSPDPDKLDAERSIQFHEPHGGNSKIRYRIVRRLGRRLNRAYGWSGSSFTLEEKLKSKP